MPPFPFTVLWLNTPVISYWKHYKQLTNIKKYGTILRPLNYYSLSHSYLGQTNFSTVLQLNLKQGRSMPATAALHQHFGPNSTLQSQQELCLHLSGLRLSVRYALQLSICSIQSSKFSGALKASGSMCWLGENLHSCCLPCHLVHPSWPANFWRLWE